MSSLSRNRKSAVQGTGEEGWHSYSQKIESVAEVADNRENHRPPMLCCGSDGFLVTHRSAGVDDRRHTSAGSGVDAVAEREEHLGGPSGCPRAVTGTLHSD